MRLFPVKYYLVLIFLFLAFPAKAQFKFTGQMPQVEPGTRVYLSLVEDYRKINRVYIDQIIRQTITDSLGYFEFSGDNLYPQNRIYRIHMDSCTGPADSDHFMGTCDDVVSVLFLANNQDNVDLPAGFDNQLLCTINSDNPNADVFIRLAEEKEAMIIDFAEFNSEANRQLNLQKWFAKWQKLGKSLDEPLAELYIYELLSDKRNPTYNHYLAEVSSNPYYDRLLNELESRYPNASFTRLYQTEISADRALASFRNPSDSRSEITIYVLLAISVLLNLLLFFRWRRSRYRKNAALDKLTRQERIIVDHILSDMSNKEIAEQLFVSVSTVKTHINNLYKKLEVTDRKSIKSLFGK